ncbi:MAG: TrmH family RNA methyltransferase [Alkalispirochaeta sp.]
MKDPYATDKSDERLAAEEEVLRRFVSDRRWERMQHVLDQRSRYISVAVEDIYQPHNASAVLRSCDAFGVQDVHIIENRNRYQVNPGVELGTAQWLSLYRYRASGFSTAPSTTPISPEGVSEQFAPSASPTTTGTTPSGEGTLEAIGALRAAGYRIVATTPHRDDVDPDTLPLGDGPIALFFGAEKEGLSETMLHSADEYLRIPMRGFVESLNISVSAAVCLNRLGDRLRQEGHSWRLPREHRLRILNRWLRSSVKNAAKILERELP